VFKRACESIQPRKQSLAADAHLSQSPQCPTTLAARELDFHDLKRLFVFDLRIEIREEIASWIS
jgi:hypothetical protein